MWSVTEMLSTKNASTVSHNRFDIAMLQQICASYPTTIVVTLRDRETRLKSGAAELGTIYGPWGTSQRQHTPGTMKNILPNEWNRGFQVLTDHWPMYRLDKDIALGSIPENCRYRIVDIDSDFGRNCLQEIPRQIRKIILI